MISFSRPWLWLTLVLFCHGSVFAAFDHSHSDWDAVLKKHVRGSLVDYAALSEDSRLLDMYLEQLNSISRAEVDVWPREKQLAFWINAYNAYTVRVILDYYPIKTWTFKGLVVPRNSIIQIPGVWKNLKWKVAGQSLTLDHIEHGLIRPTFKEPRIHFAIVCASIGCPNLRPEAFTYDKLENQLEDQTRTYLFNSNKGVRLDYKERQVCVSKLFKCFNEDFEVDPPQGFHAGTRSKKERITLQFLSHYFSDPEAWELMQTQDADFGFLSCDWFLNELPPTHDPAS